MSTRRGIDEGLAPCHTCGLTLRVRSNQRQYCPRCGTLVRTRKPNSIGRTWALVIAAMLMYIPANTLPVMRSSLLGNDSADTIMSGVVYFLRHGEWPLAAVIFIASVLVPLLKLFSLVYLLLSVQRRSTIRRRERARLYRLTELIGRWSMVDVFVVALLAALVQLGNLAHIEPGLGATAFSAVVVLTMFAALSFDPRLIWDHQEPMPDEQ